MYSSETCKPILFGLIETHKWYHNHNNTKKVCVKCGLFKIEKWIYDFDYEDSYWSEEGIIDDPNALITKWKNEIKKIQEQKKKPLGPKKHKIINWKDV